mgnify:CR=1 FL=1
MNTASKLSLTVVALLALGASAAQAQSAQISATATVQTALTVTAGNDLDFGPVFPGAGDRTIAPADANAGTFSLAGAAAAEVAMTFVLPPTLDRVLGGASMTIGSWTGVHNTSASAAGGTAFDPTGGPINANLNGTGDLYVFLGATLTVPAVQTAGDYAGTITLNASYTGN